MHVGDGPVGVVTQTDNMAEPAERCTVGIDFGTASARVAVCRDGRPVVVRTSQGLTSTPVRVHYSRGGAVAVGRPGDTSADPASVVFECKRLLGRTYNEVKRFADHWPFKITDEKTKPKVHVPSHNDVGCMYPEVVAAAVFTHLKELAKNQLKTRITRAVLTVPASFDHHQRQSLKTAARLAGLDVPRILTESAATALAFYRERNCINDVRTLVCDVGAGCVDASVVTLGSAGVRVQATRGVSDLGGSDFTNVMVSELLRLFYREHGLRVPTAKPVTQRLRELCEDAKRDFATVEEVVITIPKFYSNCDLDYVLTRDKFEQLTSHLVMRLKALVYGVLDDALLKPADVDEVLLVGGSSQLRQVRGLLQGIFHGRSLSSGVGAEDSVVCGAALQAAMLDGHHIPGFTSPPITELLSTTLSLNSCGGVTVPVLPRNTPIPVAKSRVAATSYDDQDSVEIVVLSGESAISDENRYIGAVTWSDVACGRQGERRLRVTLEVDESGLLDVHTEDGDGRREDPMVWSRATLSECDVSRLLSDLREQRQRAAAAKDRGRARDVLIRLHDSVKLALVSDDLQISPVKKWDVVKTARDMEDWLRNSRQHVTEEEYRKKYTSFRKACDIIPSRFLDGLTNNNNNDDSSRPNTTDHKRKEFGIQRVD